MIVSTLSFAMHILVSSFRFLKPVSEVLELVLPLRNMASRAISSKNKINFDTKHLKKGDPLPPYNGKLRIYNMRYCPYAQRTILALIAKDLDFEVVNIDLMEKPEWLTSKSPLGKVPSIEIQENVTIYESLITVEYLDEAYTNRPLLPKDPVRKAFDKIIIETFTPVTIMFVKALKSPDTITEDHRTAYSNALSLIQGHLKSRGTKFLHGNEPGYVDYMIWPWFERIWTLQDEFAEFKIDAVKYKLLIEYFENMFKDPVVSQYLVPTDVLLTFVKGFKTGKIEYDLLLKN